MFTTNNARKRNDERTGKGERRRDAMARAGSFRNCRDFSSTPRALGMRLGHHDEGMIHGLFAYAHIFNWLTMRMIQIQQYSVCLTFMIFRMVKIVEYAK
mmetsp:Transcript_2432/g.5304  ORF Transcript_2432/g.5304 Transcript_2432/m.5304 type:complete len:99 (-) Transcript_2432:83-379(-)